VNTVADLPIDTRLETVADDRTLESTLRYMFDRGYSQVGVERDGDLTGVLTYQSIARTLLVFHRLDVDDRGLDRLSASAATDDVHAVDADTDVLALFDALADRAYVVTRRDGEWRILTDYDLLSTLRRTLEPFLLIESIETSLRALFERVFGDDLPDRLAETFDDDHPLPTPASVDHCSFGHYAQFVSIHWSEFDPVFDEGPDVVRELIGEIGDTRNRLFHFRVDDPEDPSAFDPDLLRFGQSYFASVWGGSGVAS
jgi:CBS domain-containing protein